MNRKKILKLKNEIKVLQKTLSIIGEDKKISKLIAQKTTELNNLQNSEYIETKHKEFLRGVFVVKQDKMNIVLNDPILVDVLERKIFSMIEQCEAIYGRKVKSINITDKMLRNFLTYN